MLEIMCNENGIMTIVFPIDVMESRQILTFAFLSIVSSSLLCSLVFYAYLKAHKLGTNPRKTGRFITVNEVVNYHLKNQDLPRNQKRVLLILKWWEVINLILLPSFLILGLILAAN